MKFDNFKIETWDIFPNPCYNPQDRYGNPPATFYDLMCDERVPANDRIWAFANCTLIPDNIKRVAAVRFVRETPLVDGRFVVNLLTDERSLNALNVVVQYAQGLATDEDLDAACAAARYAAMDAAWDAARYAAMDAARYAASDAAMDAARYAASAAAMQAARYAACAAARAAQIEIIKSMINESTI